MTNPIQTYTKAAAVLLLLSLLAGGFGEFYVPNKLIVSGDGAATANNFTAYGPLFRLGFASYLVEALCDVSLSLIFYVLLRPVGRGLALLAAFFGLVSTATFAIAELFYFSASHIAAGAGYLRAFSPEQVSALLLLALKVSGYCAGLFLVFHGVASIIRGYLIVRSGYLPKFLGALLLLGGFGFVTKSFTLVLASSYSSPFLLLPMIIAMLSLTLWLFVRGVDVPKWEEKAAAATG